MSHAAAHGRGPVARALAELAPGEVPSAVAAVRRFLADPRRDPCRTSSAAGDAARHHIVLGLLGDPRQDRSRLDVLVAATEDADFLALAEDYVLLGSDRARTAAERLAAIARAGAMPGASVAWRQLLALGPAFHPLLRPVLNGIVDAGTPLHDLVGSPAARASGFEDDAAALALRSLPLGPAFAIRRRHHREDDVVTRILACGEHYRQPTLLALTATAQNTALSDCARWHAVHRLAEVDADAFERTAAALLAAGVADPTAGPLPPELGEAEADAIRERVARAWHRIREQLRTRYPDFVIRFGPGASAAEIAALESELGFALPVDFAASLALHRAVEYDGLVLGLCPHHDIGELAERRTDGMDWEEGSQQVPEIRGDYGWRPGWVPLHVADSDWDVLDLDPAPAGRYGQVIRISHDSWPGVQAPSWLAMLERVADDMESGRYTIEDDGRTLWRND
ncbi:SMI1/KNR4 family protein [Streptomyces sp. Y1]|uniref:SMI1/KNR4 family protein n=1 Tax=Streptomyces sp. Y1 TaxID=3238634 RepID=A0AB39TG70_9ACTN